MDALNHETTYNYDAAGQLESMIDGNGNTNEFSYNPLGQLAALADGNGHVTSWTYNHYAQQVTKTDGNGVLIETNGYNAKGCKGVRPNY